MIKQVWEIEVERDEGFTLNEGTVGRGVVGTWQGWRVKYRPLGTRGRWTKFVTDDDLRKFGVVELQAFCTAHNESRRGR